MYYAGPNHIITLYKLIIIIDIKPNLMPILVKTFRLIYYVRIVEGGGTSNLFLLSFYGVGGPEIPKIVLHNKLTAVNGRGSPKGRIKKKA